MNIQLSEELISLFNDATAFKALATIDGESTPNVVTGRLFRISEEGNILYLEHLESSRTNHNLVGALWFERQVSIAVQGRRGENYQIKGRPVKVHITGTLFQKYYIESRAILGEVDLSGVWVIEPTEVIDESPLKRQAEEEQARPFFRHLDRFCKSDN
ncbi:MAG: hypothetical protein HGA97_03340 [Chlorobiaceae bacterium]|nr:hypothetical protein [Chlorobiaceae bacterium]